MLLFKLPLAYLEVITIQLLLLYRKYPSVSASHVPKHRQTLQAHSDAQFQADVTWDEEAASSTSGSAFLSLLENSCESTRHAFVPLPAWSRVCLSVGRLLMRSIQRKLRCSVQDDVYGAGAPVSMQAAEASDLTGQKPCCDQCR